jgi:hypothetical protein
VGGKAAILCRESPALRSRERPLFDVLEPFSKKNPVLSQTVKMDYVILGV